jgi:hypothetical protein
MLILLKKLHKKFLLNMDGKKGKDWVAKRKA